MPGAALGLARFDPDFPCEMPLGSVVALEIIREIQVGVDAAPTGVVAWDLLPQCRGTDPSRPR